MNALPPLTQVPAEMGWRKWMCSGSQWEFAVTSVDTREIDGWMWVSFGDQDSVLCKRIGASSFRADIHHCLVDRQERFMCPEYTRRFVDIVQRILPMVAHQYLEINNATFEIGPWLTERL